MPSQPKRNFPSLVAGALLALAVGIVSGCGSSGPKTIPVSGKVTYKNKPVTIGRVVFQPVEIAKGLPERPAMGEFQDDGSYRLSSFTQNDGPVPGKYCVVIHAMISGPTPENPTAPTVWAVPQRYTSTQTTPLKAQIPSDASGALEFNFELTD
ncbi:MAG: hypothetical protein JXM70_19900 [Pirellulales bacterium]|nr:hypothetical protein [Pirellulales bacterium]